MKYRIRPPTTVSSPQLKSFVVGTKYMQCLNGTTICGCNYSLLQPALINPSSTWRSVWPGQQPMHSREGRSATPRIVSTLSSKGILSFEALKTLRHRRTNHHSLWQSKSSSTMGMWSSFIHWRREDYWRALAPRQRTPNSVHEKGQTEGFAGVSKDSNGGGNRRYKKEDVGSHFQIKKNRVNRCIKHWPYNGGTVWGNFCDISSVAVNWDEDTTAATGKRE